jgi:S1-C subfamily serine protease
VTKQALKLLCAVLLLICWQGQALAEMESVKLVKEKKPLPFQEQLHGKASSLKTIKTKFENPPVKIGIFRKGFLCLKSGDLIWNKKLYEYVTAGFSNVYRNELIKNNYAVPEIKETIFEEFGEKAKKQSELQVGIFIKEVNANLCTYSNEVKGGVYMKILWQVYAPEIQKVVFETVTEGSYQSESKGKTVRDFFHFAFMAATRNFLSERGFYDVVKSGPSMVSAKQADVLKIKGADLSSNQSKIDVTNIRTAVVTITGDTGTGTGFFISQDGNLLTNQHVVGNARFVKVRLATGRELVGEVIRSNKGRDVALVKTEPISVSPISLRKGDLNIGEDVFALGSPLGHTFSTTLTKGILSGYRKIDDREFLQSDVTVLPGNSGGPLLDSKGCVVGITVAGVVVKGFSGMNFFIPIGDALSKLSVEIE